MSDNKNINFQDILMTHVVENCTGQYPNIEKKPSTAFANQNEEIKRQLAVTAALELIRADVGSSFSSGGSRQKNEYALSAHLDSLSSYTDKILEAMKTNNQ